MALHFVDHRRTSADKYSWVPPFDWSVSYENDQWWDDARYYVSDPWFVQVLEYGVEVARIEMDDPPGGINPTYLDVPVIGDDERLEVQLIEVATTERRRKVGTRVVYELMERHSGRRLFAYSETADEFFWSSLGWERFDHPPEVRSSTVLCLSSRRPAEELPARRSTGESISYDTQMDRLPNATAAWT